MMRQKMLRNEINVEIYEANQPSTYQDIVSDMQNTKPVGAKDCLPPFDL
jgi:hypothetical protein